ncbi:MAG: BACON domain-containing protein [Prevotellaceae bacterium]|jgi:hypothetical protein|nr:BACON domain-containing protein [Prevotellaceae bacterium]
MKKLFLFFSFSALLLWGCTPADCVTDTIKLVSQTDESLVFDPEGETITVPFTSLLAWKVISHPNWVSVDPMFGPGGVGVANVDIIAEENNTGVFRYDYVVIVDSNGNKLNIYVCQNAPVPIGATLTVAPDELFFAHNETTGTDNVTITTNQATWTITSEIPWLTVSATTGGTGSTTISVHPSSPNTGTTPRAAMITVTAGALTETFTVTQLIDLSTIPGGGTSPTNGGNYVGAFWKANETGERIIRNYNIAAADAGNWTAAVVWYDDRWNLSGGDGIVLSGTTLTELTDRGIYSATPGDAEANPVTGSATIVSGTVATGGEIIFRIGLTKKFSDTGKFKADDPTNSANDANYTSTWPARYAVVLLSYNNNTKTQKIFIRQGEGADYLMHYNDAINSGGMNNAATSGSLSASSARPAAVRFSPYNLTAETLNSQVGFNGAGPNPGIPAAYPTQAGAFFSWASTVHIRYAWDPISPNFTGTWNTSYANSYWTDASNLAGTHETCPSGYRRPTDGVTNSAILEADASAVNSEFRQSLWLNPPTSRLSNIDNVIRGFYADGFFDRRAVVSSPTGATNSAVSTGNNNVAYVGHLFYNPVSESSSYSSSLFFPGAGIRSVDANATLTNAGNLAIYLSSSSSNLGISWSLGLSNGVYAETPSKTRGLSVRCVR